MTANQDLRFRDLGPLAVESAGASRLVVGARLESALALLLIHAGHVVGADALGEAMWGEQGTRRSAKTVGSHIWRLRQLLEPDRAANSRSEVLVRESGGYRLAASTQQIDSVRYAELAAEAGELLVGTMDCWVIWKLTGGTSHVTDATNASRTLLFDLKAQAWSAEMLEMLKEVIATYDKYTET